MRRFLLLAVAVLLFGCAAEAPPKFHATDVTGADWGQGFSLKDPTGTVRQLSDFKGQAVLLFFGYTQCPDICPSTLATAAAAINMLGAEGERIQVLFVTLDPARDTPDVLAKYAPAFNPRFIGLYGNEGETAAAAKDFKVYYQKQAGKTASTYSIDHTAASYAFDPQGRLRLFIKHGTTPEQLAADLKILLKAK